MTSQCGRGLQFEVHLSDNEGWGPAIPERNLRLKYRGPHLKPSPWNEKHTWSEKKNIKIRGPKIRIQTIHTIEFPGLKKHEKKHDNQGTLKSIIGGSATQK